MLTPQSTSLLRALSLQNPMDNGFVRSKKLALTTGYIAFIGILISSFALWIWLWHNTHFQDSTVFKIAAGTLTALSFYIYTHIRRGFGTFFILLTLIGIATVCTSTTNLTIFSSQPFGSITVLINIGLFVYGILSRSILGIVFNAIFTIALISVFWFYPQLVTPWILISTGIALLLAACISRYFILLNSYY